MRVIHTYNLQPSNGLFISSRERNATPSIANGHSIKSDKPKNTNRIGAIVTDIIAN